MYFDRMVRNMEDKFVYLSLEQGAKAMGYSHSKPRSTSQLCLGYGCYDEMEKSWLLSIGF